MTVDERARPGGGWFWISLAGAFAAGTVLRLYRLGSQPLLGDELHAVRAVLSTPWPEILTAYRVTDYCLPLAGLARFLLERGAVLSEVDFRGPVMAAGILLLGVAPLWARRVSSTGAALVFPWLVALSPDLVLYSRIARSYAPASLLALAAAAAFFAWWRTGRRRWMAAYAGLGALAVWFSLVVAPFAASALVFGILGRLGLAGGGAPRAGTETPGDRGGGPPGWLGLALAGLGLAAGSACFLVPGWESLAEVLEEKPGRGDLRLSTVLEALQLLAGSRAPAVAVLFWLLAARGLGVLARRHRGAAVFTACLVGGQAAALAVSTPYGLGDPLVLARYLLVALPVVLLWVAHGVGQPVGIPGRWLRARSRPGSLRGVTAGVAVLFLALLVATGPFTRPRFRYSSFVHQADFLAFHRSLPRLPPGRIPAFYQALVPASGERARDEAIVELPSHPDGADRALHLYQDRHRRRVVLGTPVPQLTDPRVAFRNRVAPDPEALLATGGRYLVVHRDLAAEERAVELPPGAERRPTLRDRNLARRLRKLAAGWTERLTELWGPPDWREARLVAWDLDRVRERVRERELELRSGRAEPGQGRNSLPGGRVTNSR